MSCKILVTGSQGQLGQEFQKLSADYPQFGFHFHSRASLDISDQEAIEKIFTENDFDFCINCAAFTKVDQAESEEEKANLINALAVKDIADQCEKHQTVLIHFSTDYVYHNGLVKPLKETDPTIPQSIYAKTKLEGENLIEASQADYLIFRTSWVYSSFGHNFLKTMYRLGKEKSSLNVVNDQFGAPTYAFDLANISLQIIQGILDNKFDIEVLKGTYNLANHGMTTWYAYAKLIMEYCNLTCTVNPIPSLEYPTPAKRPPYSLLDMTKFETNFIIAIPTWEESVKKCLDLIKS